MKKLIGLALATCALSAAPAFAQTGKSTDDIRLNATVVTNEDGRSLPGAEVQLWNRDRWGRNDYASHAHWTTWDTNKNGLLDDMEWKMIEDSWSGSSHQAWSEFDMNNDGRLDNGERGKVRDYFNAMQMKRGTVVIDTDE